jgi:hypothetical protein
LGKLAWKINMSHALELATERANICA